MTWYAFEGCLLCIGGGFKYAFIEGELSLLSYDAGSIFILKLFFQYYREAKQTGSRRKNSEQALVTNKHTT